MHMTRLAASAESGDAEPDVSRWSVDAGGGQSSGGAFELRGVVGQPDVDPLQPASGGSFSLTGGVLAGLSPGSPPGDAIFSDGFEIP